jgi:hypothetical protein
VSYHALHKNGVLLLTLIIKIVVLLSCAQFTHMKFGHIMKDKIWIYQKSYEKVRRRFKNSSGNRNYNQFPVINKFFCVLSTAAPWRGRTPLVEWSNSMVVFAFPGTPSRFLGAYFRGRNPAVSQQTASSNPPPGFAFSRSL